MEDLRLRDMLNLWVVVCSLFLLMGCSGVSANVVLIAKNVTQSFDDSEANFGESVSNFYSFWVLD